MGDQKMQIVSHYPEGAGFPEPQYRVLAVFVVVVGVLPAFGT
jgi:hypothetical protein